MDTCTVWGISVIPVQNLVSQALTTSNERGIPFKRDASFILN